MADSEASATALTQAARERKAARAAAVRRLCQQVSHAVPPYFGAMWVCNATVIALIGTRWDCGRDSPAEAVAKKAYHLVLDALGLLAPFGAPLLFLKIESCRAAEAVAEAREVQSRRRPESNGARLNQDRGGSASDPWAGLGSFHLAMFIALFAVVVMMVAMLVQDLAPAKGSPQEKFGAALGDIANFVGCIVLNCCILPRMIIQLREPPM